MKNFKGNFKGLQTDIVCPLCKGHEDLQDLSTSCRSIFQENNEENKENYMKIFNENIPEETIKIITKIDKARKEATRED